MRLFRLPGRETGRFEEDTPRMKIARHLLIILLFSGVALGLWFKSQRRAAMTAQQAPQVMDATGSLSGEQQKLLAEYAKKFLQTYGIAIMIRVQHEPFPAEVLPAAELSRTFFLGLSLRSGEVRLEVPPLAAAALGGDCIAYLRHAHFPSYFAANNWQGGLAAALTMLAEKLDHALPGHNNTTQRVSPP